MRNGYQYGVNTVIKYQEGTIGKNVPEMIGAGGIAPGPGGFGTGMRW